VLDLVTAGEAFDDLIFYSLAALPKPGEEIKTDAFAQAPGGGTVITAVAAARLGLRCAILSGVSAAAARAVRAEGVRVRNLRRRHEPAAITVALSTARDRCFVTFNGVNTHVQSRIRHALARVRARHVHLAFFPTACRPWIRIVEALRARGITTSWDFGWNPPLVRDADFRALAAAVDYLFMNRDEVRLYSRQRRIGAAIDRWRDAPRHVVVKLGAAGSRLVGGGHDIGAAAPRVRVVDTTGAGDAFNGGFLAARLRGGTLRGSLHLANRVGALSTRHAGGIAALPHARDVL
jgi:hypothetical protein